MIPRRAATDRPANLFVQVWDIQSKRILHQFGGHEQDIYSLDFASDGRHIASGSGDRTIRLWDIQENQCILTLAIEDGVTTVAISPDNRFVAAGSLDKSVRIWDTQTGVLVERTEGEQGHKDSVYSVAFSPDGRNLVSGSLDKTIKMWELNNAGFYNRAGNQPKSGKCVKTFEGHKDFVLSVALTPDGQWVMSGSKDRGVQFWDPATGQAQLMLQGHKNSGKSQSTPALARAKSADKFDSHLRRPIALWWPLRHGLGRHEGQDLAVRCFSRDEIEAPSF